PCPLEQAIRQFQLALTGKGETSQTNCRHSEFSGRITSPLEDETPARDMIGGIRTEEIDPHSVELLSAIGRQGLQGFVVLTVLALLSQHREEIRIVDETLHPDPQLGLEGIRILTESIVKQSYSHRLLCSDRTASLSQIERSRLTHAPRQR